MLLILNIKYGIFFVSHNRGGASYSEYAGNSQRKKVPTQMYNLLEIYFTLVGWHTASIGTITVGEESKISVLKSQLVLIMYAARNFFKCKSFKFMFDRAAHNC